MTDNQQRARDLWNEGLCNSGVPVWSWQGMLSAALDEAEARGRAEVAQRIRELHTRDGYGLCRECTTYADDGRDVIEPVSWPCSTRHWLAARHEKAS